MPAGRPPRPDPPVTEASIEGEAVRWCEEVVGGLALKVTLPGRRGMPDRLFLFPDGLHLFVEFKKPGGKESANQVHMRMELNVRHHKSIVVTSVGEVMKAYLDLRTKSLDLR